MAGSHITAIFDNKHETKWTFTLTNFQFIKLYFWACSGERNFLGHFAE